jgi:hypothetical protein
LYLLKNIIHRAKVGILPQKRIVLKKNDEKKHADKMENAYFCGLFGHNRGFSYMTAERLIRLLQHPEQLEHIPYEELKTLVLAYPFSHHLRQLLYMKGKQVDHHDTARNLAAAAAHSLDRGLLFKRVSIEPLKQHLEVLELKPIETVMRTLEAIAPVERAAVEVAEPAALSLQPPIPAVEPAPVAAQTAVIAPETSALETLEALPVIEVAENITAAETVELVVVAAVHSTDGQHQEEAPVLPEKEAMMEEEPSELRPTPPQPLAFGLWAMQFRSPALSDGTDRQVAKTSVPVPPAPPPVLPDEEDETEAPTPPQREKSVAQQLAERSVADKEEVVSETLAKILARQGHKDKAISMYERLIFAQPEKSAIFAAAIEELKK